MTAALGWIGARARWVLAAGVILATLMPDLSAMLRPALPGLVALVFCLAMLRLDLEAVARRAVRPRRMAGLAAWMAVLLVLTPAVLAGAGRLAGLPESHVAALVYTGAAPPITSAAGLCLIMRLDAALALELTVVASLLTPLVGPAVVEALAGNAVPVDAPALALRVGAMIAAGAGVALAVRRLVGPAAIAARARALDGVQALAMLAFVVPLFDGFWEAVLGDPGLAAGVLALALAANLGMQALVAALLRRRLHPETAGAAGLIWGNRTVALYLAALPPEPVFALYVALYQIPMLFTPLVMGRALRGRAGPS